MVILKGGVNIVLPLSIHQYVHSYTFYSVDVYHTLPGINVVYETVR